MYAYILRERRERKRPFPTYSPPRCIKQVKAGMAVKLELTGESTLEEEYYDAEPNERHLSLMLPGALN